MDLKETIIKNVLFEMKNNLTKEQETILMKVLSDNLIGYTIKDERNLPSTEIASNDYVIEYFLNCKKLSGRTEKTIERYKYVLRKLDTYVNGKPLILIETNDLRNFLYKCGSCMSQRTVEGMRLCINSFYSWLENEDIIVKNPCKRIDRIKYEVKQQNVVDSKEMVILKDSCDTLRERVLVDLLDSCGLRCMEVPNIKIEDINFTKNTINVHGKGNKERKVILNDECLEHIKRYLKEREIKNITNDYLICRKRNPNYNQPLTKGTIEQMIRNLKSKSNELKKVSIHGIRRKFATDMNRRGMSAFTIQKLLGHASVSTTQIYIKSTDDDIIHEYNLYKN